MFRTEKMKPTDFPFAVELANTADWNMAESDFKFMSRLEPDGCFTLWHEKARVGIATCINYGKVGWFGNLAVKNEYRRKGAGTFLVKHAVEYLKSRGVETVGLYAYQHLVGFYGRVGFESNDEFIVLKGVAEKPLSQQTTITEADMRDIPALTKFDTRCMGWDRRRLFKSVLREKGNLCSYLAVDGEVVGFVVAKVYDKMTEIGPILYQRENQDAALQMVKSLVGRLNGMDVYVCVPAKETALLVSFEEAGLRESFRLTRMFLGPVPAQTCVYVPESMERG
jgi:ribosomal protein S18 acetylase RimI-like enzyme